MMMLKKAMLETSKIEEINLQDEGSHEKFPKGKSRWIEVFRPSLETA